VAADLADHALVARCRAGDQAAWQELVRRHATMVHAILRGGFRLDQHAAEDVFQDVFTRVYLRLGSVRDDSAVRAWIGQIARNAALDWLRRSSNEVVSEAVDDGAFDEPLAAVDQALIVREALTRLPEHQQQILDRFFAHDESYRMIAEALGLPPGTIASRISRALAALRKELESDGRSAASATSRLIDG
jgi:RNA polymerase sigma-70 factor (ECF subfamily)